MGDRVGDGVGEDVGNLVGDLVGSGEGVVFFATSALVESDVGA